MSQLYDIYQSDTFHLARSVIIKYDLVSEAINRELQFKGYSIAPDFPTSYKYYLNLSGEYHVSDHDTLLRQYGSRHIMVDVATNTGYESVPFRKELFHGALANRSLLNEYQLGSSFYNRLVEKYPAFENLIRGILNPVDIDEAIRAPDSAILTVSYHHRRTREDGEIYYTIPPTVRNTKTSALIETQEHNLITELQKWVSKTLLRWVVPGYSLTDDLYAAFVVGIVAAMLPSKIMNIRWENVHTSYAHTFHIKEYLNSHGLLGKYVPFIPLKEVLYLYRNVRYLELNFGKTHTFHELIENMLSPTGVPLAGYFFKHDISDMRDDDNVLLPEGRMLREHINFKSLGAGSDRRDIREVLDRQVPLARENYRYLDNVEQETRQVIRWSGDDELIVKVLESELTDIADPIPVTLASQLVWFWAYTAARNWYTGNIFVSNPVTGDRIALTPLSAFILMIYCSNVSGRNKHLEFIPNDIVTAHWITKSSNPAYVPEEGGYEVKPSFEEVRGQSEKDRLSDTSVRQLMGDFEGKYIASDPTDFFEMVKEHHDHLSTQFLDLCKVEDAAGHGYGEHLWFHMFWHDIPVQLTDTPIRYDDWLPRLGIDFGHFNQVDYDTLAVDLISACTGLNDEADINRVELQRAMIEILKHFGSYTTHYLHSANQGTITNSHGKYVRVFGVTVNGDAYLEEGVYIGLDMFNDRVDAVISQTLPMNPIDVVDRGLDDVSITLTLDSNIKIQSTEMMFNTRLPMHQIDVVSSKLTYDRAVVVKVPVPPSNTVLYDYTQYLSASYLLFDNQPTSVQIAGVTGAISDFPYVTDTIPTRGLFQMDGRIERVVANKTNTVSDTISTSGLVNVSGSLEFITRLKDYDVTETIMTGLVQIDGVFNPLDISNQTSSADITVNDVSGVVMDMTIINVNDNVIMDIPALDGVGLDQPDLNDTLDNNVIIVSGGSYDEPVIVEDTVGVLENATGEVVDDSTLTIIESVDTTVIDVGGTSVGLVEFEGGTAPVVTNLESVTGDSKDDPTYNVVEARNITGRITKVTGHSTDTKLPSRFRDRVTGNIQRLTGDVTDTPYITTSTVAVVDVVQVDGAISDHHLKEMTDRSSLSVSSITGNVFDETITRYSNSLGTTVTNTTGSGFDEFVNTYGESAHVNVVSITGTGSKDDPGIETTGELKNTLINVSGSSMDWVTSDTTNSQSINIESLAGSVLDDTTLPIAFTTTVTDIVVTGRGYDQADKFVPGAKGQVYIDSITGDTYDDATLPTLDKVTGIVHRIEGNANDDPQAKRRDDYWHRVSRVTGMVLDVRKVPVDDSALLDVSGITGKVYDAVNKTYTASAALSNIEITGDVNDEVKGVYAFSVGTTTLSVYGEVVDTPRVDYGFSTSVDVTNATGEVIDFGRVIQDDVECIEVVDITGGVHVPSEVYPFANSVEVLSVSGTVVDTVVTYGASVNVNVLSINGDTVEESGLFERTATRVEPISTSGKVYDDVATSYVYKSINVNVVSITGVITDEDE